MSQNKLNQNDTDNINHKNDFNQNSKKVTSRDT